MQNDYAVSILSSDLIYPQQEICLNCQELNRSYRNMIESEKLKFENEKLKEISYLKKQLEEEQQERLRLEKIVKDDLVTIQTQSVNLKKLEEQNLQHQINLNACKDALKRV